MHIPDSQQIANSSELTGSLPKPLCASHHFQHDFIRVWTPRPRISTPINFNDVDHCGVDEVFFFFFFKIENFGSFSHVLTWRTWKNGLEVRSSCGSLMSFANLILNRNLGEAYPMQLVSASGQWIISTLKSFLPSMDSNMTFKYIYIRHLLPCALRC